jgi:hypothetical protein
MDALENWDMKREKNWMHSVYTILSCIHVVDVLGL